MTAPIHQLTEKKIKDTGEDPKMAIKNYIAILKKEKHNTNAYNRLMILYRKQKEYAKEAALITTAIDTFEAFYAKHQPKHTPAISKLSRALAIATGLATKKGQALYDPEPIAIWRKRLATLKKRFIKK